MEAKQNLWEQERNSLTNSSFINRVFIFRWLLIAFVLQTYKLRAIIRVL